MQIFEFHFNPKAKEDLIFDSFCYEPENVYERRLGSLFLVGELKNALPQNLRFLDNFVSYFKREYYSSPIKFSPEAALKLGLKKTNEFLEGISKSGDVSWLGNLNLAILSFKNFDLNLTKVGAIKILLLRQGQLIDIGKNLEFEDIEPYPLKIFGNMVAGKLAEGDIILVLTKEVFNFFSSPPKFSEGKFGRASQNLLKEIAKIEPFEEKKLRTILKTREKELLKISGVCLLLLLTKEVWTVKERQKSFTFQQKPEKFSFKKALYPLINLFTRAAAKSKRASLSFPPSSRKRDSVAEEEDKSSLTKKRWLFFPNFLSKLTAVAKKFQKLKKVKVKPEIKIPKINISFKKPQIKISAIFRKNLALVSSLILVIILGFFIFKGGERAKLKEYQLTLTGIRENMSQAENYLALNGEENKSSSSATESRLRDEGGKESEALFDFAAARVNEKNAFLIYKKAWQDILLILEEHSFFSTPRFARVSKEKSALQGEAVSLKDSIQKSLEKISKLEQVSDPSLLFEFNEKEFIPQKMVFFQNNLYLFSPLANNVYKVNPKGEKNVLQINQPFNEAAEFGSQILFFQKPNLVFFFKNNSLVDELRSSSPFANAQVSEPISLSLPYPDFDPKTLAVYRSSIYFLDEKKGEIIKYPAPLTQNKDFPQTWLAKETKKAVGAKSIAIDGPIWILNKDNTISQYFGGNLKETITPDFFPEPENLSSIQASYELFYVLEPAQKRIIVLTKTGDIIKQYQSEKFDNLKDFAVSEDGKTIWLLNGVKVYQINF